MRIINMLGQFVLYNLAPSLVAGLLTYLMVFAAIILLRIRYTPLRLSLYFIPVIRSVLVLLGIKPVLPWPADPFTIWHAHALAPRTVLPFLLLWGGLALMGQTLLTRSASQRALQDTQTAEEVFPRLAQALERVLYAFRHTAPERYVCDGWFQCAKPALDRPRVLVSHRRLSSPLILTTAAHPAVIFPAALVWHLSDVQLEQALAHELAHLTLRRPRWCSTLVCHWLAVISPVTWLLVMQLHRAEEKACDEIAVAILGHEDVYAEMLLKSYHFATESAMLPMNRLQVLPQLLGAKPMLSERVENILQSDTKFAYMKLQRCGACLVWCALLVFL